MIQVGYPFVLFEYIPVLMVLYHWEPPVEPTTMVSG